MIPTGFKLYLGIAMAAAGAAAIGGYTSGGTVVGPISAGYKGGIGDHVSYVVLLGVAFVSLIVGTLLTVFRDADAEAVASAMGVSTAPVGQRPVASSIWPIVAGVGFAFLAVGMAVSTAVVGVGIVILTIVAFEWTMTAWADRATGDSATNASLRNQVMGPFEVPLLGLLGGAVFVFAASRIFLKYPGTGAVVFGAVIACVILAIGVLMATNPKLSKNALMAITVVPLFAVLIFGAYSAATTEHHDEHHGDDHSDDHSDEIEESS